MMDNFNIVITRREGGWGFRSFDIRVDGDPVYSGAVGDSADHIGRMVAAYIRANEGENWGHSA